MVSLCVSLHTDTVKRKYTFSYGKSFEKEVCDSMCMMIMIYSLLSPLKKISTVQQPVGE